MLRPPAAASSTETRSLSANGGSRCGEPRRPTRGARSKRGNLPAESDAAFCRRGGGLQATVSAPRLDGCVLILADPMLATGASINIALKELTRFGTPAAVHVAAIIASTAGVEAVEKAHPNARIWAGAIDEELTAKSYIVPGLGDAGDLAYGEKQ